VVIIPESTHKERMQENFDLFDFELTAEEMELTPSTASSSPIMSQPWWSSSCSGKRCCNGL